MSEYGNTLTVAGSDHDDLTIVRAMLRQDYERALTVHPGLPAPSFMIGPVIPIEDDDGTPLRPAHTYGWYAADGVEPKDPL